jgi:uncharacterized membrane protein YphA (DoxX/SURF4 family)
MAGAKRVTEEVLSWIIGGIFLYAGVLKLLRPDALLVDIQSYQLVPYRLAYLASYYLPAMEIIAGAGMLHRWLRRESAFLLLALTAIFIFALTAAWLRGLDISCGCFGAAQAKAKYPILIGRDSFICVGIIFVLWVQYPGGSKTKI